LFYASTLVDASDVEAITNKAGWFGPILIALFILATQVFAPLSGTPGIFVGIKLYGFANTLILFYFTSLLSATINFWLARKYGRKIVAKFVGEKTLNEIDELSKVNERVLLITSRIFGYYFFDIISYAVGLTKIKFMKYFIYTALLTLIPTIAQYFIFSHLDFNSFGGMLIYFGSIAATGAIFTRFFYKVYVRRKDRPANEERRLSSVRFFFEFTLAKVFLQLPLMFEDRVNTQQPKVRNR
jgi:uncharacterized membrane protein YdjX (TVP38/TMEM64 family)